MHIASAGPGHGSTFRLELALPEATTGTPVAESMPESMPGGGAANGAQGAGKTKRQSRLNFPPGCRVLHVEDDAILRRSFELRVLKKLGVPFDVAVNGAEAVRATHTIKTYIKLSTLTTYIAFVHITLTTHKVRLILEERCEYALVLMDNQVRYRHCLALAVQLLTHKHIHIPPAEHC